MNTGILKAEGLCKSYGSKRVLEGLEKSRQEGAAPRRAELRTLLDELNEMKKEWEAWQL